MLASQGSVCDFRRSGLSWAAILSEARFVQVTRSRTQSIAARHSVAAAWLFLLSRVVYRSMLGEGTDDDTIQWQTYGIDVKVREPMS